MSEAVSSAVIRLARAMREHGVRVGTGEVLSAHRALAEIDVADRRQAYLALRATLCGGRSDLAEFDAAFAACFDRLAAGREAATPPLDDAAAAVLPRIAVPAAPSGAGGDEQPPVVRPAAWSPIELRRARDFAEYTASEREHARGLIAAIARSAPLRRSRRTRTSRRRGQRPDLRATLRASLRHGGEAFDRRWRERTERPRPLVLVCDVSGSMEPYARMLLVYLHACVSARRRVEAFAFGTRLTRITRELADRDPDRALARATAAVADWSGGTRIGDALSQLNRVHGRRLSRGAVVVVLSDGWDRGEPGALAAEMARLRRCCHRIVWLNPLKAHPGYEPLTRGMRAALPHVDHFLAGNSLASLEELASLMDEGLSSPRPAPSPG